LIVPIFGLPTTAQTLESAVEILTIWAQDEAPRYVCPCPVYTLMLAEEMPALSKALSGAAMVSADGMPIVWLQQAWGYPEAERVYGPDIVLALAETKLKHYFLGGMPDVAEKLSQKLQEAFPKIEIIGAQSLPELSLEIEVNFELVEQLNQIKANVLWISLGSPKQEIWMAAYRPYLTIPLMIGVGAAFDFLAGTKPQAPNWMRRNGLEWLFRLLNEPKRLGKRYFVYNSRFLWKLLRFFFDRNTQIP
jgi:N-acetylglucosaminyldiphosphoundecaprenol N-acetyl-beta-D-mannosaminyltransferase